MKKKLQLIKVAVLLFSNFICITASSQTQFQTTISGNFSMDLIGGYDGAMGGQQTADGGYVICAGVTGGFTAGNQDVYLVKFDNTGAFSWAKTYGGTGNDYGRSVQQTSDGGYIIAGYTASFGAGNNDAFLIKTNSSGNLQWSKTYGGPLDEGAVSVQQTSDGGYILAGYTNSTNLVGNNNTYTFSGTTYHLNDTYLIKTNSVGDTLWVKVYSSPYTAVVGVTVWMDDAAYSIRQTTDGGYIVAGTNTEFFYVVGRDDITLLKIDAAGNKNWGYTYAFAYGSPGNVEQTADGGYILSAGQGWGMAPSGLGPARLYKTNAAGMGLWMNTYNGTGGFYSNSNVKQTADNGYILTTSTADSPVGWNRICLIKTNTLGNVQQTNTYATDSTNTDSDSWFVQQTSDGGYMTGGFLDYDNMLYLVKTDNNLTSGCSEENTYPITTTGIGTYTPTIYNASMHVGGTVVGAPTITVGSGGSASPVCPVTLPIELLYFNAKKDGSSAKVICDWSTATETNNDYFAIERSQDGITFTRIGIMPGSGTTSTTNKYSYYDEHPFSDWSYYRLKQVDYNGNYTYSNINTVYIGYLEITTLYPNPATDNITISIATEQNTEATTEIYNTLGQAVYKNNITLEKGKSDVKISTSKYAAGQYLFKVSLPTGEHKQKVFMR